MSAINCEVKAIANIKTRYGDLVVQFKYGTYPEETKIDSKGRLLIWCACACGNPSPAWYKYSDLDSGKVTNCGQCAGIIKLK